MTKYMAAGAFQDLTADEVVVRELGTWLAGLAASGRYNGHALRRALLRGLARRHLPHRPVQEGRHQGADDAGAVHGRRRKLDAKFGKKGFSPVYIAGEDWYVAMGFVFDYGGNIATRVSGKWKGALNSPKSVAGLTAFKNFFNAASHGSKTTIETQPNPYDVYAQGNAASMIGPTWFTCCVKPYTGVTGQFVMPSHTKGQVMPGFLGGSDLAVPVGADKALGADWIRDFTSTSAEKALEAKGNIPNTTSLFNATKINERAAARSWFVPTAKHWVDVENGNVLRTMLAEILTNKYSVKQAATFASDNITSTLNQS